MTERTEYGKGNAYAFDNFPDARKWVNEDGKEWERGLVLGSHLTALEQIYGPPAGSFKGSEYKFSVWTIEHDGLTIHLLAAEGKGCCMEVELPKGATPWSGQCAATGEKLPAFLAHHLAALESVLGKRVAPTTKKKPSR